MAKLYFGIDNGASGSIGVLPPNASPMYLTPPTKQIQDYTKKANMITRIDQPLLEGMLVELLFKWVEVKDVSDIKAILERPFVNPMMFKTTGRALRSFEATLITLERLNIPHEFIDSRAWQKEFLPEGIKGAPKLKKASKEVGMRIFPSLEAEIKRQGDADGLLIAEWARRHGL